MTIREIQIVLPTEKVDNLSFFKDTISDIEKFIRTTGIRERFIADKKHQIEDYFLQGIQKLSLPIQKIDGIITVSQTPSKLVPSMSNYFQYRLPLRQEILNIDTTSGCSGFTEALSLAQQLFRNGNCQNILICAGDFSNHIIHSENTTIQPLFSDIASVTWVEKSDDDFISNHFSYGTGYTAINSENHCMTMNGLEVFQLSTQYVAESIVNLLNEQATSTSQADVFYFHQANRIINDTIIRQLQIPKEKAPFSLQKYGNASSASIPLTMAEHPLLSGEKSTLLLSGFGVGFRVCNVLLKTSAFKTNITTFEI